MLSKSYSLNEKLEKRSTLNVLSSAALLFKCQLVIAASFAGYAHAESEERWVIGSFVNVRSAPNAKASVVDHVTANTQVKYVGLSERFCDIQYAVNKRGFVSCELIGSRALSLEEVEDQSRPTYSPARAFWIQPSVERLFKAGSYFDQTMLSKVQRDIESSYVSGGIFSAPAPEIKRFRLPEFEAMKARMAQAAIAGRALAPVSLAIHQDPPKVLGSVESQEKVGVDPREGMAKYAQSNSLLGVELPSVKASYFKKLEDLGAPSAGTEQLSAQFGIQRTMRVLGSPTWGGTSNTGPTLEGAWDIGEIEVRLVDPLFELAIDSKGQTSVGKTFAITRRIHGGDECRGSFLAWEPEQMLPRYKKLTNPIVFIRLAAEPKLGVAIVRTAQKKLTNVQRESNDPYPLVTSSTTSIDLDKDGVPDVVVWEAANYFGMNGPAFDLDMYRTKEIYVNINGQWFILDTDSEHACGC
ncbi:MAG: hypothetical protein CFE43_20505 [Burkholderiales bacterium PBB3]|nr:MAG: hypothetical protein CFE43_20505 [Burkholderiales bacterium PBB3]